MTAVPVADTITVTAGVTSALLGVAPTYSGSGSVSPSVPSFTAAPLIGPVGGTVQFTDNSTGTIDSRVLNFGDGTSSTAISPSHVYASAGTFTPSLTTTNASGSNTQTRSGYIQTVAAPVASFVGSPLSGPIPLTVQFADASTGSISSWAWTFGDGNTSALQSPSHTYTQAGTYTISLTVAGIGGSSTGLVVTAVASLPVSALPSWVPAAGEIVTLTGGTGITNNWRAIVASTHNADPSVDLTSLYNGYTVNPHWGSYGAIFGFGGGHAQTNDNSVWCLELGASSCTFKRLTTPTNWGISSADNDTGSHTVSANYGENFDGQPAAPHSYQTNVVFGPESGGAACGTFLTVVRKTVEYGGTADFTAAHSVAMANSSGATGSYSWARHSNDYVAGNGQKPAWAQYVPAAGYHNPRVYYESRGSSISKPKWFDLTTLTYGDNASGNSRLDGSVPDGGVLIYVPSRSILVYMDESGGYVRAQYMDVSATNPSWVTSVTLSSNIPAATNWGCGCWCSDNSRIIAGAVSGDANCVYEIALPATLSDPWTCTRVAFTGGQTITWAESGGTTSSGRWEYNAVAKVILHWPDGARLTGNDVLYAYRPRNT